jgi:hypothetical protein
LLTIFEGRNGRGNAKPHTEKLNYAASADIPTLLISF